MKRRLYVLPCGRWLVKMVSSDLVYDQVHWKPTITKSHDMASSMSRITWFYLCTSSRELHKTQTSESHIRLFVNGTKARWCCPWHHPSLTAFVLISGNHWTTCWMIPKAGPKTWSPKVLSRWRSSVGLNVCLLKKSATISVLSLKGVVTLPKSKCCLQKCFLIPMCRGRLVRCMYVTGH